MEKHAMSCPKFGEQFKNSINHPCFCKAKEKNEEFREVLGEYFENFNPSPDRVIKETVRMDKEKRIKHREIEDEFNQQLRENGEFLHFIGLIEDYGMFEWMAELLEYLREWYEVNLASFRYVRMMDKFIQLRLSKKKEK